MPSLERHHRPYALLPLLFLFASISDEHKAPRWLDFGLAWLGKLSMPLWFIHYAFFAGYVNAIVPLFDVVSSARVGVAIVLLALVMCIPVALVYHFIFLGAQRILKGCDSAIDKKHFRD